ncbi:MAG: hypothetical protein P4L56_31690 [Candidatus Sulfopaludibacter sp.]|nr:hypothetical protein [Candidatus Sulfopaludibacter sp.]
MPEVVEKGTHSPRNSLCVVGAEALLVLLPFVVMAIVLAQKGELSKLASMPEWGVASSALIGLSMVRFAAGLLHARTPVEGLAWERVLLLFALIIVLGLVPSLLVLSLVLIAKTPSSYLSAMQIVFFLLSLFLFISLGWAGEHVLTESTEAEKEHELTVLRSRAAGD